MTTNYSEAAYISADQAIRLLNAGHSLTKPGKDLDTLTKGEDSYEYIGMNDRGATILDENQVRELIKNNRWAIDLFD